MGVGAISAWCERARVRACVSMGERGKGGRRGLRRERDGGREWQREREGEEGRERDWGEGGREKGGPGERGLMLMVTEESCAECHLVYKYRAQV